MFELFQVVPYTTRVPQWSARAGQRAYATLVAALKELEDQLRPHERYVDTFWKEHGGAGSSTAASGREKTVIVASSDTPFILVPNKFDANEFILGKDVHRWKRVTLEDYHAWHVNELMTKNGGAKWTFQDRWLPLLPSSETPERQAMIVGTIRRR